MDFSVIASAVGSLNAAREIANSLKEIRDEQLLQKRVIELNNEIISAQNSTFSVQTAYLSMSEKIRELQTKIDEIEKWNEEKKQYKLVKFSNGSFAFEYIGSDEIGHCICANCYQDARKSILQETRSKASDTLKCQSCDKTIRTREEHINLRELYDRRPVV